MPRAQWAPHSYESLPSACSHHRAPLSVCTLGHEVLEAHAGVMWESKAEGAGHLHSVQGLLNCAFGKLNSKTWQAKQTELSKLSFCKAFLFQPLPRGGPGCFRERPSSLRRIIIWHSYLQAQVAGVAVAPKQRNTERFVNSEWLIWLMLAKSWVFMLLNRPFPSLIGSPSCECGWAKGVSPLGPGPSLAL